MQRMKVLCGLVVLMVLVQPLMAAEEEAPAWKTTVAIGASTTSGNSDTLNANASVGTAYTAEKHELTLGIEGNYGETAKEDETGRDTTTRNAKASVVYKRKFGTPYAYSDNSIFHDQLTDLDYRLIIGAGGGFFLLDNETRKLSAEAGLAHIREEIRGDDADERLAFRLAARHDETLSETASLWLAAEYMPEVDDTEMYLFNAEAGVQAALNSKLSVRLVAQNRYDSDVPEGREKSDLSVVTSLVYSH